MTKFPIGSHVPIGLIWDRSQEIKLIDIWKLIEIGLRELLGFVSQWG